MFFFVLYYYIIKFQYFQGQLFFCTFRRNNTVNRRTDFNFFLIFRHIELWSRVPSKDFCSYAQICFIFPMEEVEQKMELFLSSNVQQQRKYSNRGTDLCPPITLFPLLVNLRHCAMKNNLTTI